jgi:beta-phosphoglucomutase-like phosphatase (HAD superfamily)
MNKDNSMIILTDCDGVLVNWDAAFTEWVESKGFPRRPGTAGEYSVAIRHGITAAQSEAFIKEFNESDAIANLLPFADAVEYVGKIAKLGFKFIVVTSVSSHPDAKKYRTANLTSIFGDIFEGIHCIEVGASKAHILRTNWGDTGYFWVEDHMRQAEAGHEAGLSTILINHPYNHHYETDLFPKVSFNQPWKEIYGWVLNRYLK